jgi:hypothetical protein
VDEGAQRYLGVQGDDAKVAVEVAVVEDVAFAHEGVVVLENALCAGDAGGFAFDFEIVIDQLGVNSQAGFEKPDVLVPGAEEALDASWNAHASFH